MQETDEKQEPNLSPTQEAAINLLATGSSLEEAATVLGVSINTLKMWRRRSAAFREKLRELGIDIDSKV